MSAPPAKRLLFVHQFPLATVNGVTVMLAELVRLLPRAAYLSFPGAPASLERALDEMHSEIGAVFAVNIHIEVGWPESLALADWCRTRDVPLWNHVHDYWPQHREGVAALLERGVKLAASTPFVRDSLRDVGFSAEVIPVGIPLPTATPQPARWERVPRLIASAGRLISRKRFPDVAAAFARANLAADHRLYLRLLRSNVFSEADDAAELVRVEANVDPLRATIDRVPTVDRLDCSPFFVYVAASAYEGFSMVPIEAAYVGCPPLMSDIPAHRAIAGALFGADAELFLYPMGDVAALAAMLADEAERQTRRAHLARRGAEVRRTIRANFSLEGAVRALSALG